MLHFIERLRTVSGGKPTGFKLCIGHPCESVKLLATLLPFVQPGELLRGEMSQQVFRLYWPMAQASSFSVAEPLRARRPPGATP